MLRDVAVLVLPGVAPFELGIVCELFGLDRSDDGLPVPAFALVTEHPGLVPTNQGFPVGVEHGLERMASADLVVTAPVPRGADGTTTSPAVREALREAHARGARLMSACSGVFPLAEAGLLDGRRATTHWRFATELATRFPDVTVDGDVLYVEDGTIVTSAGSAAVIDAGLHLLRGELGAAAVATIARRMVVPPHRDGGQAQYIATPVPLCDDEDLSPLQDWALAHLADDLSVERLAHRAAMSPRTLARRFADVVGTSPASWVARQRLLRAQELLESTTLGVDAVAAQVGWGSGAVLRHHFARIGTTPLAYRRTFAGVR